MTISEAVRRGGILTHATNRILELETAHGFRANYSLISVGGGKDSAEIGAKVNSLASAISCHTAPATRLRTAPVPPTDSTLPKPPASGAPDIETLTAEPLPSAQGPLAENLRVDGTTQLVALIALGALMFWGVVLWHSLPAIWKWLGGLL